MINKIFSHYLITLLTLLLASYSSGFSQGSKKQSLRAYLTDLEKKHAVSFNYVDATIDGIFIQLDEELAPEKDLSAILKKLENLTDLRFRQINDFYISIEERKQESTYCGYLLEKSSKRPIEAAFIKWEGGSTTTSDNGFFTIKNANPSLRIGITHINHSDTTLLVDLSESGCDTLLLPLTKMKLKEVVVERFVTKGIVLNKNASIEINTNRANLLPGMIETDVFFMLQNMPGIMSVDESVSNLNIRGGSNDQTAVYWNDLRLYQTSHFFGLISSINPYIVDKSTLTTNGTHAAVGEGVSGSIQLETNIAQVDSLKIAADLNLLASNFKIEVPLKKVQLKVAARNSINLFENGITYRNYFDRAFDFSDLSEDPDSEIFNTNESFRFNDIFTQARYDISSTSDLQLGFFYFDNSIQYDKNSIIANRVETRRARLSQNSIGGFLNYTHNVSDQFQLGITGSLSRFQQNSINSNPLNSQEQRLNNEVIEQKAAVEGHYFLNATSDLNVGLEYVETGIANDRIVNLPSFQQIRKDVLRSFILYSNYHLQLKKTSLEVGLRNNYFGKLNKIRIEPRLSLVHRINKQFSATLKGELKSQTSTQTVDFQNDFLGVDNRKWELVNGENIPLITSQQLSTGLIYQLPKILLSSTFYLKAVDGIVANSQGFLNQFQFSRSAGGYTAYGLDLLINPRFENIDIWTTYSFLSSAYTFPELSPSNFPNNFEVLNTLTAGLSYTINDFKMSAGIHYHSGKPFTEVLGVNGEELVFRAPNQDYLPDYMRIDISADYTFYIGRKLKFTLGGSIWNLTNNKNVINRFFNYNPALSDGIEAREQLALGFTPNLNLRIHFQQ